MAIISTGSLAKALMPGVNSFFGASYSEYPAQYKDIFSIETSEKNFEEDVNTYGTGLAVVKPEGSSISYDAMAGGLTKRYVHVTYALGFIITREAIEDNQYMQLAEARAKRLAFSMVQTKENVAANVINRAFTSGYTGADGIRLVNSAHLLSKGGTMSNIIATAADLSEASLEQGIIDVMGFKDDAGLLISVTPQKLLIPRQLAFEAERILKSNLQNDSANNATNALRSRGVLPGGVVINQFLTDTDAWFLLTNAPDGLKMFERRAVAIDNDTDFDSENMKFKASERFSVGWSDFRCIYGSAGA